MKTQPIAITAGDPAGIGPDILLKTVAQHNSMPVVAIADMHMLQQRAMQLNYPVKIIEYHQNISYPLPPHVLAVNHVPMLTNCQPGIPNPHVAQYILNTLQIATDGCLAKQFRALVTGPINKKVINDAGIAFTGHTEWLMAATATADSVMLLQGGDLKVALLTTHLPLKDVAQAITKEKLQNCIEIIYRDLNRRFHISSPRILVCGLNPHAGDGGYLGKEEQDIIIPVLEVLRKKNFDLTGPVSADTAFTPKNIKAFDVILTMYHDQGLPVLKHHSFGEAINVTLGLPIIRTSVDHGTAYDIAGTGEANPKSLQQAIALAAQLST